MKRTLGSGYDLSYTGDYMHYFTLFFEMVVLLK